MHALRNKGNWASEIWFRISDLGTGAELSGRMFVLCALGP